LILTVDAGNSRTKFGLFENPTQQSPQPVALTSFAEESVESTVASLVRWVEQAALKHLPDLAVLAGSRPQTRDGLRDRWPFPEMEVRVISEFGQIPVGLDVDSPERVGTDRLLNALAVSRFLEASGSCIVVDSGTATTVDLVTHGPVFHGGAILPGVRLAAHAMHDYTAKLPMLEMDQLWDRELAVPARNTEDAMLSGLLLGHLGAVRELLDRMSESAVSLPGVSAIGQLVLTGGGGRFLQQYLPSATYIDCLALHGLAAIACQSRP